jgi:hypothetical protein
VVSLPQLSQLFEEAVALPPEERVAYLDRVCNRDAPHRAELESEAFDPISKGFDAWTRS